MSVRTAYLVFDAYVPAGTAGAVYTYTPSQLNGLLGYFDTLGFQAVVDKVTLTGSGSLRVYLQHSADNLNFVFNTGTTIPPATPDISLTSLSTTAANVGLGAYFSWYPLLANVRLAMQFGESTTAAHIKLFLTQRDLL